MFRWLVTAFFAAIVAMALGSLVVAGSAAAHSSGGRGGGGGGGGGHSAGSVHTSGHSSAVHLGRSGVHSPSYHGGPSHKHSQSGKLSKSGKLSSASHKLSTTKLTHSSLINHNHNFFGRRVFVVWFGPIFWPYAFFDLFDYVFWVCDDYYYYSYGCYSGYGPLWAYGYGDLFGGIYWPHAYGYGSGDRRRVARNDPQTLEPQGARADELAQLCGGEAATLVHFPFDRIERNVQPTDAQRGSFEELKRAAAQAADKLKASCPTEPALGPIGRIDTAEQRLDAMLDAVSAVRGPLMKFYDSLSDQQKARLDAIGLSSGRETGARGGRHMQTARTPRICSERSNAVAQLSIDDIERNVRPNEAQRPNLDELRKASLRAADAIQASCPKDAPLTVTTRLEAVEGRLSAMLDAIKTVRGPLEKFYDSLQDEQKARFNRMGPPNRRTG
jgi:hypothetical protein